MGEKTLLQAIYWLHTSAWDQLWVLHLTLQFEWNLNSQIESESKSKFKSEVEADSKVEANLLL